MFILQDIGSDSLHRCPVTKTSAARVPERAIPGGVDSSFTETLDKQGMSEQDLDCQGKQDFAIFV